MDFHSSGPVIGSSLFFLPDNIFRLLDLIIGNSVSITMSISSVSINSNFYEMVLIHFFAITLTPSISL